MGHSRQILTLKADVFTDFGWQSRIDAAPAYYRARAEAFLRTYAENVRYQQTLKRKALRAALAFWFQYLEHCAKMAARGASERQLKKVNEEAAFEIAWLTNDAYLADIALARLARMQVQAFMLAGRAGGRGQDEREHAA